MTDGPAVPEHWRMRAEQVREMALNSRDSVIREALFEIAETYDRLATLADGHHGAPSKSYDR